MKERKTKCQRDEDGDKSNSDTEEDRCDHITKNHRFYRDRAGDESFKCPMSSFPCIDGGRQGSGCEKKCHSDESRQEE